MTILAKKRTRFGRLRGMTLIEVLISLVIMTILLTSLLFMYAKGQKDFLQGNVRSDVLEKARFPLNWVARDTNVAKLVDWQSHGYFGSGSVLILDLPCLDANGYVIGDDNHHDDVIYYVANNRLTRSCYPNNGQSYRQGGDKVLADNVAGLAITYYDTNENVLTSGYSAAAAVKVAVTLSVNVGSRNFKQTLSSRFTLRNKAI